ncbi:hypothetical protein F4677DRAFT_450960 [Hypoxylon crocopeplum]|nr:hypothetical protein F4677DRAFT_450960 [Hypoxylon crocopeplum]
MRLEIAGTSIALLISSFATVAQCTDFEFLAVASAAAAAALGFKIKNHIQYLKRDVSDDGFAVELGLRDAAQVEGGNSKRATRCLNVPADVPTNVVDNCCAALNGVTITVSGSKATQKFRVDGLPYPCISLAPWFDQVGNVPYACGDACLEWGGLSGSSFDALANAMLNL